MAGVHRTGLWVVPSSWRGALEVTVDEDDRRKRGWTDVARGAWTNGTIVGDGAMGADPIDGELWVRGEADAGGPGRVREARKTGAGGRIVVRGGPWFLAGVHRTGLRVVPSSWRGALEVTVDENDRRKRGWTDVARGTWTTGTFLVDGATGTDPINAELWVRGEADAGGPGRVRSARKIGAGGPVVVRGGPWFLAGVHPTG